mmetsp:Transcript_6930/g.15935  ORF Transcript_6930/g.15935 Transcript_6930/m.15935 type:complete len:326 (-) Transcript_6930:69-1046(-)|eukprot:CAMPEP_0114560474 /NCGR_PEP_ID=MMETSP0114-20121206/11480_1 /TAXON_ID=31324 /ORGANISM="Goniomonas sp, Strain m" /LENGTH=325 /DNA_ID=CAMNT_0001746025 /DNA_START=11 /DNA_END=988 /DNA_ORIENTATION=-
MGDVPQDAPQHCPGTESGDAGKVAACAGCPNQKICASAPKGPDPDIPVIAERMSCVGHKILVLSGKGGVGKSTFSTQLAWSLSGQDPDMQIGLLDIDICGPSVPKMVGMEGETVRQSGLGWTPVYPAENLAVVSVGFLLTNPNEAVIWRGPKKNGLIKQFLKDVYWGDEIDCLVVDCPPGTSDEHLSITSFLATSNVDGAIIVTTPQEMALLDVRKEINFCKKVGLPVLGVVENMKGFACPKCHVETEIFAATTGGAEAMATSMGVPFLGSLPLDPELLRACEAGKPYLTYNEDPDAPLPAESNARSAFRSIVAGIKAGLKPVDK